MDSLTHIVIGACIGEAMLGKKIGKRAMLLGAVAQSIPDIDFIAAAWTSASGNLLAHRGFTHSILFALILTPLFALLSERWHRPHNISIKRWMLFFACNMLLHIFLDAFNVYGVGWLEPFSHHRFSFNVLFVADPLFSIWPGIAFVGLLLLPAKNRRRIKWVRMGLIIPACYLLLAVVNKKLVDREIKKIAAKENMPVKRLLTTPTPLNIFLWYVAIENDSGYDIGYRSVFDSKRKFNYRYFSRNDSLLQKAEGSEDLFHLRRFSQGFYTAEKRNDTLIFNDIRFGQEIGWTNLNASFIFHFYLNRPGGNKLVLQRGRFTGWDWQAMKSLLKRMAGR